MIAGLCDSNVAALTKDGTRRCGIYDILGGCFLW